ncbi:hypothetical protein STEG23_025997, partial [Scotinomys teguina]
WQIDTADGNCVVNHTFSTNIVLQRTKQEENEFEANVIFIVNSRPAYNILVQKIKAKQKQKQMSKLYNPNNNSEAAINVDDIETTQRTLTSE